MKETNEETVAKTTKATMTGASGMGSKATFPRTGGTMKYQTKEEEALHLKVEELTSKVAALQSQLDEANSTIHKLANEATPAVVKKQEGLKMVKSFEADILPETRIFLEKRLADEWGPFNMSPAFIKDILLEAETLRSFLKRLRTLLES